MARRPATASTRRPDVGQVDADESDVTTLADAHREAERELPDVPPNPVMEAYKLNVFYGDFHAVHDVSLTFGKNEITALIGPSGAASRPSCAA